ncbi:hypothetical protein AX14_006311 [Amanita brunnescens Koide BX004]|nr:hypothetical protein AX14_006311 [Amanita brunnescens Koide BX004]
MLFSYALLFFLFTTFATAAPTMMLQKRSPYDLEDNTNFLVANGGEWTRDKSKPTQGSQVNTIKWLTKSLTYQDYGYKPNELYVEIKETEHWVAQLRPNEKPGNDLLGTWEREKTGSKIEILQYNDYPEWFRFKVLEEGTTEKEEGPNGLEVLANHVDFLTAAGGVWVGSQGEKIIYKPSNHRQNIEGDMITFRKDSNRYGFKILTSSYTIKDGSTTSLKPWGYSSGRDHAEDEVVLYSTTRWKRQKTGSEIEIQVVKEPPWAHRYYFKIINKGTLEDKSNGKVKSLP